MELSKFVKFIGFRNDVHKLLHAVDYILLPSIHEGLPLIILEAQASKVLVLAAPTAGIPEVVKDGCTGFLIEADNPKKYAEVIIRMKNCKNIANSIVEEAYKRIKSKFCLKKYCKTILNTYDSLI